jgi:hypothetical protein
MSRPQDKAAISAVAEGFEAGLNLWDPRLCKFERGSLEHWQFQRAYTRGVSVRMAALSRQPPDKDPGATQNSQHS